jgi:hypothetical protein
MTIRWWEGHTKSTFRSISQRNDERACRLFLQAASTAAAFIYCRLLFDLLYGFYRMYADTS